MNGNRYYGVRVEGAKYGVGFGSALAIAISYTANHSILWAWLAASASAAARDRCRYRRQSLPLLPGRIASDWATVASLIETCKLNDVDPLGYLTDVLARIVNGHSNRDIDQLLPWAYRKQDLKAVA